MSYCTNCGANLDGDENYCQECGSEIGKSNSTSNSTSGADSNKSRTQEQVVWKGKMSWLGAMLTPAAVLTFGLVGLFTRASSEYMITTEQITSRHGFFNQTENLVRIDDIRDIRVERNFIDRILGIGDVMISTAGRSGAEIQFKQVAHPMQIVEYVEAARNV